MWRNLEKNNKNKKSIQEKIQIKQRYNQAWKLCSIEIVYV